MSKNHGLVRAFARGKLLAFFMAPLLPAGMALAEEREPLAVIELGVAAEWGLDGGSSFGPSAAVEFPVIKNWLEVETGVQTLFKHGQTEWDADFVFKKPFDLSPTVEFEPGIGPVWIHTISVAEQPMPLEPRPWRTSCFGRRLIAIMAGCWSPVTPTLSALAMSNRSASASVWSFPSNS